MRDYRYTSDSWLMELSVDLVFMSAISSSSKDPGKPIRK